MIKLLGCLALAAGLAASASAGAATYNLGALSEGVTSFGAYTVAPSSSLFSDTIDFSISQEQNVAVGGAPLNYSLNNTPYMGISSIFISMYGPGNVQLGGGGAGFSAFWLPAGNYQVVVNGFTNGTAGGEYAGALRVSPVPEPGSTAMMLAGLGLLAYIVSRRKA